MINHNESNGWRVVLAGVTAMGLAWGFPGAGWSKDKEKEKSKGEEATHGVLGYVLLGEKKHGLKGETVPVMRLVLEHSHGFSDASCQAMTMTNGDGASMTLVPRPNPNPGDMPITLCEAILPLAKKFQAQGENWTVTDTGGKRYAVQLPTVGLAPDMALIMGDTGCRGNKDQNCDAKDWPFPSAIAQQMAELLKKQEKPALIIHVGDYKYRGKNTPKPNGDSNQTGLKWTNWKADFFNPMSGAGGGPNLFAMASWVTARGNHELCKSMGNNGESWFFLLDPTSSVIGDSAQQVQANSCQGVGDGLTRPYRMDFTNGLSIVMMDTAGLNETKEVCDTNKSELVKQFKEMAQNFKGSKQEAWLVTHKPLWIGSGACGKASLDNPTPQAAIEELEQHALPENIKLALVGHKHIYASLDINPDEDRRRMLELGVGNSGVALNPKVYSGCLKHDADKANKEFRADVRGMSRFGFVVAKLDVGKDGKKQEGWKLKSMALDHIKGPDWGALKTAEVCEYPVKKGKPACEIKEKDLFAKACGSCDKVNAPDKKIKECHAEEDEEN